MNPNARYKIGEAWSFWGLDVLDLAGHLKAKRAYDWSLLDGDKDTREYFVPVLEILSADSAESAVRVQCVEDLKV